MPCRHPRRSILFGMCASNVLCALCPPGLSVMLTLSALLPVSLALVSPASAGFLSRGIDGALSRLPPTAAARLFGPSSNSRLSNAGRLLTSGVPISSTW
jgi:hypothetical protein